MFESRPPESGHDDIENDDPSLVDPQGWHWVRMSDNLPHSRYLHDMSWRDHHMEQMREDYMPSEIDELDPDNPFEAQRQPDDVQS